MLRRLSDGDAEAKVHPVRGGLRICILVVLLVVFTYVGALVSDLFLSDHGGGFFPVRQQIADACLMIAFGLFLSVPPRVRLGEIVGAIVTAEILIMAVVQYFWRCWDFFYLHRIWQVTVFTTLPFSVAVLAGYAIHKRKNENGG